MLMLGMDIMVTDMDMDIIDHMDTGDTMERDLLMKPQLLDQTLMLMLMPGMVIMVMDMVYGYYRPYGYWGYYGKRSADEPAASGPNPDADADAWYGYYGRGYGYGYYRPYGYWGYYGKRSADEAPASGPNPDADADAWYGYYGHGYGYGYYRPYGYYGYGYWGKK